RRAQRAEAEAARLRAELALLRAEIAAERAALTVYVDGPEWRRDLGVMARDLVRGELLDLAETHTACGECGSFGRRFADRFLQDGIDALTQAHGLPPEPALAPADWPVHMRFDTHGGKRKVADWHAAPRAARDGNGAGNGSGDNTPWRPPHWRPDDAYVSLTDLYDRGHGA
ncbi:MAG: hypothetical protein AAF311_02560, partial [Pseudomonadota bacterium]